MRFLKGDLEIEFETFYILNGLSGTCERLKKCVVLNLHKQHFPIRLCYLTRHIVLLWSCNVLVYVRS